MNKAFIVGNLTREPEVKTTTTGQTVCNFTIAVSRRFKKDETDYIPIVVWNKQAENCGKYLSQGSKVSVSGEIQTRNYEGKNGKVYVTEVVADEVEFLGSKTQKTESSADDEFADIMQEDENLPF